MPLICTSITDRAHAYAKSKEPNRQGIGKLISELLMAEQARVEARQEKARRKLRREQEGEATG